MVADITSLLAVSGDRPQSDWDCTLYVLWRCLKSWSHLLQFNQSPVQHFRCHEQTVINSQKNSNENET